jgi:hypothetical protein
MRGVIFGVLASLVLGCNGMALQPGVGSGQRITVIVDEVSAARIMLPPDKSIAWKQVPCFLDEGWQSCVTLECVKPVEKPTPE